MTRAQTAQKTQYDRHHTQVAYQVGDLVYLHTRNLSLPGTVKRKFAPRWLGPFPILACRGPNAYKLGNLPDYLGIHDTINVSQLKPAHSHPGPQAGPVGTPDVYEVDRVLAERTRRGHTEYLVRWTGYPPEFDSWISDLSDAPEALASWTSSKPTRRSQRVLRRQREI